MSRVANREYDGRFQSPANGAAVAPQAASAPAGKAPSAAGKDGLGDRIVCPFCGTVSDRSVDACPRCTMENTPLTRQATKARIGPWYVLQTRNPSAPGMKFSTLLTLVRKGQVTARSVVRGPTTHQLWKFAARVKGLSREFGVCHACGMEVVQTAKACPHCARSQEPPANPDTLLETTEPSGPKAATAVFREVAPPVTTTTTTTTATNEAPRERPFEPVLTSPPPVVVDPEITDAEIEPVAEAATAAPPAPPAPPAPTAPPAPPAPASPATVAPASSAPAAAPPAAAPVETAAPIETAAAEPAEPTPAPLPAGRERPSADRILSPADLAAAFSIPYKPPAPQPTARRAGGAKPARWIAAVLALAAAAGAGLVLLKPGAREQGIAWAKSTYAKVLASVSTAPRDSSVGNTPKPSAPQPQSDEPRDGSAPPAVVAPHDDAPGTNVLMRPSSPLDATPAAPATPLPPPVAAKSEPVTPAPTADVAPSPAPTSSHADVPTAPAPAEPAPTPAADNAADPAPVAAQDPHPPAMAPPSAPAPASPPALKPGQDQDQLALQLRANAIDAETRHDYATAQYYYEQIEKLPRDSWPTDTERRLGAAKRLASGG